MKLKTYLEKKKQKIKRKDVPVLVTFKKNVVRRENINEDSYLEFYKFLINREKKLLMNYEKEGVEYVKLIIRDMIMNLEKAGKKLDRLKKIF